MPVIVYCRNKNCLDEDGQQTIIHEPSGLEYPGNIIYKLGMEAAQDFKLANRKFKNFGWLRNLGYITPSCPKCRRELSYDVNVMGVKLEGVRDYVMWKLDSYERNALKKYEKWKEQQSVELSSDGLEIPGSEAVPTRNPGKTSGKKLRQPFPKGLVGEDDLFDDLVRKRSRGKKS